MDNISHSVVGLVVGEIIHRSLPEPSAPEERQTRRRLLLFAAWFASNFPDLDLILTPLLPPPLGYLLHHRGHTHTILYAVPQAALLIAGVWLLWPAARRLLKKDGMARKAFTFSVLVGFALHMMMDYLNSYGIHPFHPFDSRWFFGDMVFIIEPFFWVSFGIPMALTLSRKWLKAFTCLFLLGVPLAFTFAHFLPLPSYLILVITAVLLAIIQNRVPRGSTAPFVLAAFLGVLFVAAQSFSSSIAKRTLIAELTEKDPGFSYLDSALSSYPTNPLCWSFVSVTKNEAAGEYRMRRGLLSLSPLVPASDCPPGLAGGQTPEEVKTQFVYYAAETARLALIRDLSKTNCFFDAWLRFARAPMVRDNEGWDIRFSSHLRQNFTTIRLAQFEGQSCPDWIPHWGRPREDLLLNQGNAGK